ncbi:hypothetical protein HDV04_005615 [Boothiomyces sp. JEL0838]|nr:hypothetical protein HDV04_005615 [Boothiomyces sp. JEL0838]
MFNYLKQIITGEETTVETESQSTTPTEAVISAPEIVEPQTENTELPTANTNIEKQDSIPDIKIEGDAMGPPKPGVPKKKNDINAFPMLNGPQRAATGNPRKIPLQPNHSPLDWAKLKASGADLRGGQVQLKRYRDSDLALHNKKDDLWMAYQGKVYNVTPYVAFHPGGVPQLMRGAGKDATELIHKIHPWVNIDMMLDKCMIGYYVKDGL